MAKALAVSAALIPFIIAAIITVFGIYKRRKEKRDMVTLIFPLVIINFYLIIQVAYLGAIDYLCLSPNIFSLVLLFIGNLIMIFAFYVAMQPSEYNDNFYVAFFPLSIGIVIAVAAIILLVSLKN